MNPSRTTPAVLAAIAMLAVLALSACSKGTSFVTSSDTASTPTVYATVVKEPNPLLFGTWRRLPPSDINKPWAFTYTMVRKGDKIAVHYFYDSRNNKKKGYFKGWADFTISGDSMTSNVDGSTFYVEDGKVFMKVAGRDTAYKMDKVD